MKGIFFKDIEKPRRLMVIISEANLNTHVCEWMCGKGRCVLCVCVHTHMHTMYMNTCTDMANRTRTTQADISQYQ